MPQSMRGEVVIGDGITYAGTIHLLFSDKKGKDGQCYGRIPDTHLFTRTFQKQHDLVHHIERGHTPVS